MNMFIKRVFLSLSIICSLFAGTYSGGSGYSFDPYQISNLDNLIELIQTPADWSKYFLQTNDIDASGSQYWDDTDDNGNGNLFDDTNDASSAGNNDGFKPIGSNPTSFKGYYNGNGYTINGISINRANTQYVGLFGYFYSSLNFPYNRIENLYLSNVNISGKDHVGSICGSVHDGVLMNCSSTGSVSASSGYAGGLAGNSGTIIDCSSSCSINNSGIYTGGLAGMLSGSIYTSYCDGDVEGDTYVGGLCGYKSLGYIYDSYSVASVSGTDNVGGLSGMLHGGGVSNCYASGEITSSGTYVGGFNGKNNGYCDVDNCFWDTVTTGMSTSPDGTGKSTNEMKTLSTYTDEGTTGLSDAWDFETNPFDDSGNDDDWDMDYSGNINNGYPYLSWQDGDNMALPAYYGHGSGTEGDPYQISDLSDLKSLSKASPDWNKYFIQTADIDASATEYWDDSDDDGNGHLYDDPNDLTSAGNNEGFPPIGTVSDEFTGNYDGNGYAINELNIDRSESYTGLFGRLIGAMITELGVTNAAVTGINYVGIIAGVNDENTSMSQCYSSGSVNGSGFAVGGLTGGVRYGTAELTLSYSTATVTASGNHAGGLIGFAYDADISDCYSRGSVNGANYVGSFCGYFTNGSVSNCYGTGSVSSTGSDVGGFVGSNTNDACIVTNCFWDTQISGKSSSPVGTGKTTSEMKTVSSFTGNSSSGISTPWDFEKDPFNDSGTNNTWDIDGSGTINDGYPFLSWQNGENVSIERYSGGNGTSGDPYVINDLNDLSVLCQTSTDWDKYFSQGTNIDISATQYWDDADDNGNGNLYDDSNDSTSTGNDEGFFPIGTTSNKFNGQYNGSGYTLNGLTIDRTSECNGLFGIVINAQITDLGVLNVNINGSDFCGAITSINDENSIIRNCYSSGTITSTGRWVGGLVGGNRYGTASISDSYSSVNLTASGDYVGGFAGYSYEAELINCYSTGSVNGADYVGGFTGRLTDGSVSNCYATGSITASGSNVGGFNGVNLNSCSISNCFWDTQSSGKTSSPDATGKTTDEMKDILTFTNTSTSGLDSAWNFEQNPYEDLNDNSVWDMDRCGSINSGYPFLCWQNGSTISLDLFPGGKGSSEDPYQISSLSDLSFLCQSIGNWGKHYIQTRDINASNTQFWDDADDNGNGDLYDDANDSTSAGSNEGFSPIGNEINLFTGEYDGDSYEISNLTISRSTDINGFMGNIDGYISNLKLSSINISGASYAGGIAAISEAGSTFENCASSGTITTNGNIAGGIVGYSKESTISNCYSTVDINSSGLVAGGLVGTSSYSSISNCYATGDVESSDIIGSLCGQALAGTMENSYGIGSVTSEGSDVGGLYGRNFTEACSVVNCFWDTSSTGLSSSPGGTGKSTADMKTRSTFTSAGWDFVNESANGTDDIWDMDAETNNGYPILYAMQSTEVPLPITLCDFSANYDNGKVKLYWSTASETINSHFLIYRND